MPQVVLLGPPASGKKTIAKMVCSKLRCAHLTPDSIVEEADTPLKQEATQIIADGKVKCH